MLARYDGKEIRITVEDGTVFSGEAEVFPSGYGLHEYDREEEGIQIDDVVVFKSDIRKIEDLSNADCNDVNSRRFDHLMGDLLEGPYWIIDILPEQVPVDADGQYFAVERYFLQPERIRRLRRKFAEILLRLNCYYDMVVSFDSCASWEKNPEPEKFVRKVVDLSGNDFLRAMFPEQNAMIDYDHNDTYMTVYDPGSVLLEKIRQLSAAEGFFIWSPQ